MGIRLKRFNDHFAVRLIAFVLCAGLFVTGMMGLILTARNASNLKYSGNVSSLIMGREYKDMITSEQQYFDFANRVLSILDMPEDNAYKQQIDDIEGMHYYVANDISVATNLGSKARPGTQRFTEGVAYLMVKAQPSSADDKSRIDSDGNITISEPSSTGKVIAYEVESSFKEEKTNMDNWEMLVTHMETTNVKEFYLGFDESFVNQQEGLYNEAQRTLNQFFPMIAISILLSFIFFVYLTVQVIMFHRINFYSVCQFFKMSDT